MVIPEKVLELVRGPYFAHAGTRDSLLMPSVHYVAGLHLDAEGTMVIVVPQAFTQALRENLADNGRISVSFGDPLSHESYQLKGTCTDVRAAGAGELPFQETWLRDIKVRMLEVGFPPPAVEAFGTQPLQPAVAITATVHDVFDQTPGPGAGERSAGTHPHQA